MAEITTLSTLAKASVATTDYVVVANSSTKIAKRFQLQGLFPSVASPGDGADLYVSATLTNQNQIKFKGLKSGDTGLLTVATTSNNLVLTVLEAGIDLSLCNNATSAFLTGVDFTGTVTGTNAVVNGGTGLSTIAKGAILYASATDSISSSAAMSTHGQLLIGNTTNGYPSVNTLTAGANMTITNGAGTITLVASLSSLAATLDTGSYNIDLNTNYVSDDGSDRGIYVHTGGNAVVNPSGSTLTSADIVGQINLQGTGSTAITIGNSGSYQASYIIKGTTSPSGTAAADIYLKAATSGGGNFSGGDLYLNAGAGTGSGKGGDVFLYGGDTSSGASGLIQFYTYASGVATRALMIDATQNLHVANGDVSLTGGAFNARGAGVGMRQYQGAPANTDDGTTAVSVANILTKIITCTPTADRSKATDTASNIISVLGLTVDNDAVDFSFINLATDGTSAVTLTAGTGVTLVGRMVIMAQDAAEDAISEGTARFRIRRTSGAAVTIYRIG